MMDLSLIPYNYIVLGFFVFLAGFIDSMAGGGGLITIPAYMHFGLPMGQLLGTNKLSSSMGTTVSAFKFLRELQFKKEFLAVMVLIAAIGSQLGARAVAHVPPDMLRYLLIVVLPPVAFFIIARHRFGLSDHSAVFSGTALFIRAGIIALLISFYDGLLGPGTGTFLAVALTRFCGYDLLKATALSKLLNLTSNVSALAAFLALGRVDIRLGIAMGFVGMAGNYLGSHVALKNGAWLIRPMLFIVSNALLAKIILDMLK